MRAVRHEQIEFRVFLDFNADIVERFNRCVAREKILRARAERDDFQMCDTDARARERNKIAQHLCDIAGGSDRIFGDDRIELAKPEIVRTVEHTAVCVASSVD